MQTKFVGSWLIYLSFFSVFAGSLIFDAERVPLSTKANSFGGKLKFLTHLNLVGQGEVMGFISNLN